MDPDTATLQATASTPVCAIGVPMLFVHSLSLSAIYIDIIYSHNNIINSLSKNQWISLLLKRELQFKSKHATSLSMTENKFIKAFCLKIIFESGVSFSSCKVTNLEDIWKQIETEFHQRVGALKPLDNSNEEESHCKCFFCSYSK